MQKADEDKEYFISELDKQSMLLDELAAQKKGNHVKSPKSQIIIRMRWANGRPRGRVQGFFTL